MKPILFNTEMVRAILDGRKTVTRRVIKFPDGLTGSHVVGEAGNPDNPLGLMWACGIKRPPYHPGDILYVRETWEYIPESDTDGFYVYAADCENPADWKWKPSIHMPKNAARIFLRVTNVRAERLQDIDDDGVVAEGLEIGDPFDELWDSTIKPQDRDRYGWNANPWVWVIEFERISREEAMANGIS